MGLHFSKMHGLGNDFVVLDARSRAPALDPRRIRAMADRHTGIGFDQLLVIEPARDPACIAAYSIYNADGSPAEQCGNGARCIAAWLERAGALERGIIAQFESPAGTIGMRLTAANAVTVEMGEPDFDPAHVPFTACGSALVHPLEVAGERVEISVVSMGNPHAILEVPDVTAPEVDRLGPRITAHPRFAHGVNAGFAQVLDAGHLKLRVHERGAGWTLACGSGACAAVAALYRRGRVGASVNVALPGGQLAIAWDGPGHPLWMTGPAAFVFDGEWLGVQHDCAGPRDSAHCAPGNRSPAWRK
ncbi:MAG: diaminopimelate epimerase [Rhodanobacteraceae bacterium]|nr:MAG: diaminopimelate epimerase [Rhodanobacteraceae bacterium]